MIAIPPEMQARLDAGATTLCWCWRVERADGAVFGFTDHDEPVGFSGLVYEPGAGFSPGEVRAEAGAPARGAGFGVIDHEVMSEADLDNGVWDGAQASLHRVDWTEPDLRYRAFTGELGAIRRGEAGFEAELDGLSARLNRTIGRVFGRACDAELGDGRCGVDLGDAAFRADGMAGEATVNQTLSPEAFAAEGLDGFAPGWFSRGALEWTSGANEGARLRVAEHAPGRIELERPPAAPVEAGDGFTVTAGCDKRAETCRTKFANFLNFRGCPHMPGNDLLLRHAGSEARRDGGRRETGR